MNKQNARCSKHSAEMLQCSTVPDIGTQGLWPRRLARQRIPTSERRQPVADVSRDVRSEQPSERSWIGWRLDKPNKRRVPGTRWCFSLATGRGSWQHGEARFVGLSLAKWVTPAAPPKARSASCGVCALSCLRLAVMVGAGRAVTMSLKHGTRAHLVPTDAPSFVLAQYRSPFERQPLLAHLKRVCV